MFQLDIYESNSKQPRNIRSKTKRTTGRINGEASSEDARTSTTGQLKKGENPTAEQNAKEEHDLIEEQRTKLDDVVPLEVPSSQSIMLYGRGLKKITQEELAEWKRAKMIDLSFNEIESLLFLVDQSVLRDLQVVKLPYNQIKAIEGLKGCLQLQELYLQSNQIQKLNGLAHLTKLRILNIQDNLISTDDADVLSNVELRILNLSINKLSNLKFLRSLKKIQHLLLAHNKITSLSSLEISCCRRLIELSLSGNVGVIVEPTFFNSNRFQCIRILHISKCGLSGNLCDLFSPLKYLEELHASENDFTSLSSVETLFPRLEQLDIRNNGLTHTIQLVEHLQNLPELIILKVEGNPLCREDFSRMEIVSRLLKLKMLDNEELEADIKTQLNFEPVRIHNLKVDVSKDMKSILGQLREVFKDDAVKDLLSEHFDESSSEIVTPFSLEARRAFSVEESMREFDHFKHMTERKLESAIDRLQESLTQFKEEFSDETLKKKFDAMLEGVNFDIFKYQAKPEEKKCEFYCIDKGDDNYYNNTTPRPNSARSVHTEYNREKCNPRPNTSSGCDRLSQLNNIRQSLTEVTRPKTTANISKRIRDAVRFSRQISNAQAEQNSDQRITANESTSTVNKNTMERASTVRYKNPRTYRSSNKLVVRKTR